MLRRLGCIRNEDPVDMDRLILAVPDEILDSVSVHGETGDAQYDRDNEAAFAGCGNGVEDRVDVEHAESVPIHRDGVGVADDLVVEDGVCEGDGQLDDIYSRIMSPSLPLSLSPFSEMTFWMTLSQDM